jgi:hypothetical protein
MVSIIKQQHQRNKQQHHKQQQCIHHQQLRRPRANKHRIEGVKSCRLQCQGKMTRNYDEDQERSPRQVLYHLFSRSQQAKLPTNVGNSYNVYGTMMHGASERRGWDVQFNVFPQENHTVESLTGSKIIVVEKGGEELQYDRPVGTDPLSSTFQTPSPHPKAPTMHQQEFLLLPNEDLVTAKSFPYQWGKAPEETVHCNIMQYHKSIDWGAPDFENHMATDQIDFDDDTKLVNIFFKHTFPSIEGHAEKLLSRSEGRIL